MVYKKKTTTVYTKRKRPMRRMYKRKRPSSKLTMTNNNPNQLIAPRYITSLRFGGRFATGSAPASIANAYIFNLNSIFDPDRTQQIGGAQPFGRDQLAVLYNRYRVFGVSYKIEFYPTSSPTEFFVVPRNDSVDVSVSDSGTIREMPYSKVKLASTTDPTIIKGYVSLPKLTGQTSSQFKSGLEYQSLMSTSPSELQTLQVGLIPVASTLSVNFQITMVYHVECFDPLVFGRS